MSRYKRVLHSLVLTAFLASASYGLAVAQDEEEGPAGSEEDAAASVDARQRANLTPEDQLEEARRIIVRGEDLSRRVQAMLDEARQERDIIRVTCVNDKLTQVNANLRTAQQRVEQFQDAVQAQDSSRRNHEFTVILVLGQKFMVLDREAAQCIGQDIFETGATRVLTEIDPGTPDDDPTLIIVIEDPPAPFIPPPRSGDR